MLEPFESRIKNPELKLTGELNTLQVNVGRLCNLACKHCHVEAGPNRTEIMPREVMEHVLRILKEFKNFKVLDITGGAPEMNANFKWFINEALKLGVHVIVRSNLVILTEPDYKDFLKFYADNKIEVAASLPYYTEHDCDRQRGAGVFKKIIEVLKELNELGYGRCDDLILDLVYNPGGAFLPPDQAGLEREYKARLKAEYNIDFTRLFAIANNPVGRFGEFLRRTGNFERYMQRLSDAFNANALKGMMCRSQLSVGWDGSLYDCDFNQAAGLKINGVNNIKDLKDLSDLKREIVFAEHCYACTAGAGSSCGGATA